MLLDKTKSTKVKNGFDITDCHAIISKAECSNHPSARPGSPLYDKATAQVKKEIEAGHYVICGSKPDIISPMAAIPKPDGDVRLIHDCSRPTGKAVNDYCTTDWHQKFSRVDDAAALMTHGCFFSGKLICALHTEVSKSVLKVNMQQVLSGTLAVKIFT